MVSGSPLQFQSIPGVDARARDAVAPRESLVVLTRDPALVETLQAIGPQRDLATVDSEADLAAHLLAQSTGVAVIDAAALATAVEQLTERLHSQFPDLVLIVAGDSGHQNALTAQITNGTVYRFLHKPVSEQRVRLFVEAAWRHHGSEHPAGGPGPSAYLLARDAGGNPQVLLWGGAAAAAVLAGWLLLHRSGSPEGLPAPPTAASPPPGAPRDVVLEDLLNRAAQALAHGALVSPPRANALELYRQAQRRNAADSRAAGGIEKIIDRLLSAAEAQLEAQHLEEAQKLADEARAINPEHVRVAFVTAQIGKERERAVLAQARQAAASGNIAQALAVLDSAGQRSTLVSQARHQLALQQLEERVHDFLSRAAEALERGALLEPVEDNALFYIESARALAPANAEVLAAQQQFLSRLASEARKSLAAGSMDQAQHWIQAASDAGATPEELTPLQQEFEQTQSAAQAEAARKAAAQAAAQAAQAQAAAAEAAAQEAAKQAAAKARAAEVVAATSLELTHYVAPSFPREAQERAVSGWVDMQFTVTTEGAVTDIGVTGAEPVGLFEQSAAEALRKWRYRPVLRDGQPINQRARVRVRFALQQ